MPGDFISFVYSNISILFSFIGLVISLGALIISYYLYQNSSKSILASERSAIAAEKSALAAERSALVAEKTIENNRPYLKFNELETNYSKKTITISVGIENIGLFTVVVKSVFITILEIKGLGYGYDMKEEEIILYKGDQEEYTLKMPRKVKFNKLKEKEFIFTDLDPSTFKFSVKYYSIYDESKIYEDGCSYPISKWSGK